MQSALALYKALAPLGTPPPASDDYVSAVLKQSPGGWLMDMNDQLGCCVIADSAHQVMLHTANVGTIVVPSDQDVIAMYSAVGGYVLGNPATDQGCDESAACQYLETTGLCGQKSTGTAMVNPSDLDNLRWTVQIFGACRLGIIVNDEMQQQFSSGQPWTVPAAANDTSAGGHDVPIVKYDTEYAYVVTWGALQPVAWSLIGNSAFLDESHIELFPDFIAATGTTPAGFNLAQLQADLDALKAA
jgi:hypothetical protein